jgi:predicted nucleotidyltransferase
MQTAELTEWGLAPGPMARIRSVLAGFPEIERVLLFGSRAKGNFRAGSDIDLAIVGEAMGFERLAQLENQLDDLLLPWRIDLVLWHQIDNPKLMAHIQRVGQVFFQQG